jgi:hypothetical protein
MKFGLAVLFSLFFGSIGLAAQGAGPLQTTVLTLSPPALGCPVSLRAQHLADGSMVRVGNSHPAGVGQWLHLTLADHGSSQIVKATVAIYGLSNKARITQTAAGSDFSDVVRTTTVQFSAASPGSVAGDVRVPGMTAIQRIDLDSVAYADGTVQSFAAEQACHVTPDPLMLVAGR